MQARIPPIVDAVLLCAKQELLLTGYRDTEFNYVSEGTGNSGNRTNFLSILGLIANNDLMVKAFYNGQQKCDHRNPK